jgi:glycosyltransferase involved in cell wall biosynthesis
MKVFVSQLSATRGGSQTYLFHLLRHLDPASELEVFLLVPASQVVEPHPRVTRLTPPRLSGRVAVRTAWERTVLPRVLRRLGVRVLFCPGGLVVTSPPQGCGVVTMSRNMLPFDPLQRAKYPLGRARVRNWLLERVMLRSMAGADRVIFVSDYARSMIAARLPHRRHTFSTIPHGLSEHFRAPSAPPRPRFVPDGPYLLYVSSFEPYKGQMEVVEGYALLRRMRPTPEKLVLAGINDTPYGRAVRGRVAELGLEDDVHFTGNVPYAELPGVYAHATATVFASECENCPNILLESLGGGRPLLVSDRPPMPEFGGDAPVYFDPASPQDFVRKAAALLDDPDAMEAAAARSRARAGFYDWKRTAEQTWQVIEQLARQSGAQE